MLLHAVLPRDHFQAAGYDSLIGLLAQLLSLGQLFLLAQLLEVYDLVFRFHIQPEVIARPALISWMVFITEPPLPIQLGLFHGQVSPLCSLCCPLIVFTFPHELPFAFASDPLTGLPREFEF